MTTATEVPERPSLAPNVELSGKLRDSAFKDQQWLIQRDGHFIQLSELLYRVAERLDGKHTLEEIAAGATEATDWRLSADHVRQLIQGKLAPLGLVSTTDDSSSLRAFDPSDSSMLALRMRLKVLSPRVIDPITRVLQVLYAPPLLIPILILIACAHGWLYLVHGVSQSVLQVIYAPALALAVIAILFVSDIFHEFGHASALRYGGGKVRGMGLGVYIVYPALYTDTTDSYRLGRWARVRTALGGFYFHLVFSVGLVALYFATGWEFLLIVVTLINLDMLYQLMPTVRFDGYWALADLTGIPDFFSQMTAFLRSLSPTPRWPGSKLPDLRPWAVVVFATYIILTIPLLWLVFFLIIWAMPFLMNAIWHSLLLQASQFSTALGNGEYLLVVASALQAFMLYLEMLGFAYLLYTLAKKLWKWSKPTPTRRIAGAVTALGVVALFAFLWSA